MTYLPSFILSLIVISFTSSLIDENSSEPDIGHIVKNDDFGRYRCRLSVIKLMYDPDLLLFP